MYILNFWHFFQYLFSLENEIFQQHVIFKPKLWRRIAGWLGLLPLYSQEQLHGIEGAILSGAMDSIDQMLDPSAKQARKEAEQLASEKKKSNCVWQAVLAEDKKTRLYHCLTHDVDVTMQDKEAPSHLIAENNG